MASGLRQRLFTALLLAAIVIGVLVNAYGIWAIEVLGFVSF